MIINFILQAIFIILSYMCFKPDDILDFNFPLINLTKSINMYRLLFIITTNYALVNETFMSMYNSIVEYMNYLFESASNVDFSLIVSTV
jgi:hypothetical protein